MLDGAARRDDRIGGPDEAIPSATGNERIDARRWDLNFSVAQRRPGGRVQGHESDANPVHLRQRQHDYPQRVRYARTGDGGVTAENAMIDGTHKRGNWAYGGRGPRSR